MLLKLFTAWLLLSIPVSLVISALIAHGSRVPALVPTGETDPAVGDGHTAERAACGMPSPTANLPTAPSWLGHRAGTLPHGVPLAVATARVRGDGR